MRYNILGNLGVFLKWIFFILNLNSPGMIYLYNKLQYRPKTQYTNVNNKFYYPLKFQFLIQVLNLKHMYLFGKFKTMMNIILSNMSGV